MAVTGGSNWLGGKGGGGGDGGQSGSLSDRWRLVMGSGDPHQLIKSAVSQFKARK